MTKTPHRSAFAFNLQSLFLLMIAVALTFGGWAFGRRDGLLRAQMSEARLQRQRAQNAELQARLEVTEARLKALAAHNSVPQSRRALAPSEAEPVTDEAERDSELPR